MFDALAHYMWRGMTHIELIHLTLPFVHERVRAMWRQDEQHQLYENYLARLRTPQSQQQTPETQPVVIDLTTSDKEGDNNNNG